MMTQLSMAFKLALMMMTTSEVTDHDGKLATMMEREDDMVFNRARKGCCSSSEGRIWKLNCNDVRWIECYTIQTLFCKSPSWKVLFPISPQLFDELIDKIGKVMHFDNKFRAEIPTSISIAAYLMYAGGLLMIKQASSLESERIQSRFLSEK